MTDRVDATLKAFLSRPLGSRGLTGTALRVLALRGEPPITRQMLRLIGKDFTLDISQARKELGYGPILTPEEGFRDLAQVKSGRAADATGSPHRATNLVAEA